MKPVADEDRVRAVRGSVEAAYLLKLPAELAREIRKAAKRAGISLAEWWREAARNQLNSHKGKS